MTITQIENNITKLLKNFSKDSFVFEFLLAYGEPKATIVRIKKGDLNQLNTKGELTHRKKLFFKEVTDHLHGTIDTLKSKPRIDENPADVRASNKLAKLYENNIKKSNII